MKQDRFIVVNQLGLHARAAARLVSLSKTFSSEITVRRGDKAVDAKSIMKVMLLAAPLGCEIDLQVVGEDEECAFAAIAELIQTGFEEGNHLENPIDESD